MAKDEQNITNSATYCYRRCQPRNFQQVSKKINLGAVDPDQTRQVNDADKTTLNFLAGSIIWNTTLGVLQVYTGNKWVDIGERTNDLGFEMTASVGKVDVKTNGDITINV